ncbi:MAG: hypothetical protein ABS46_06265 [Cytophagaceae bacterium SCN 52-12]|nr:MAG: hypothetical protein ABS46_06265 [Cytophagaceae bacterium SCN 52-12]
MRYLLFVPIFIFTVLCSSDKAAGQAFRNHTTVREIGGNIGLFINDRQVPPFAYMSYLGESRYFREMADSGLEIFCLLAYLGDRGINSTSGIGPFRPSFWKGIGQYDFSVIRDEFDKLVRVKEDAKVIIRVHLDPPIWWERQNPSEVCRLPSGESYRVSFSSKKWRHDAGDALLALLDWVRASDYNRNLIGIHVAAGGTEEWFFHYKDRFYDESPARKADFRNWLQARYHHDAAALRKAWNDPGVSFETALPADLSGTTKRNTIRKKGDNPRLDDTFDYHRGLMPGHIAYFSRLVKEASQGQLLTGAFYGYHLFVHDPRRGHGSLAELLKCPDLDYLSSPNDYRRETGIDWLPMAAIRSVQLHGKLWLAENDTRTSLTTLLREKAPHIVPDGDWYDKGVWIGPKDLFTSQELIWKNAGRMLAYGYGGWWFDMWGGWFSDEGIRSAIRATNRLYQQYTTDNRAQNHVYRPEVAVVVDEKLQFYDDTYGGITGRLAGNRVPLGQAGTSFDMYLRSDLDSLKKERYKLIWYLDIQDLSAEEQQTVKSLMARTGYSVITDHLGSSVYKKEQPVSRLAGRVRWTPEQLREIFQKADVHIFSAADDVVYAGQGWLMVHLAEAGRREIVLPSEWTLMNVKDSTAVPFTGKRLLIEGRKGETFLYKADR